MTERVLLIVAMVFLSGVAVAIIVTRPPPAPPVVDVRTLCGRGEFTEACLRLDALDRDTRWRVIETVEPRHRQELVEAAADIVRARLDKGLGGKAHAMASWVVSLGQVRPEIVLLRTRCAMAQGRSIDWKKLLEVIVADHPRCLEVYEGLVDIYFRDPLALKDLIERSLSQVAHADTFFLKLGTRLESEGRLREARELYVKAARVCAQKEVFQARARCTDLVLEDHRPALPDGVEPGMGRNELIQVAGEPAGTSRAAYPRTTGSQTLERWVYGDHRVLLFGDQVLAPGRR